MGGVYAGDSLSRGASAMPNQTATGAFGVGYGGAGAVGASYGTASTYPAAGLPGTDGALRVAAAGLGSPVAAYGAYGAGYSSAGGYPHAGYANGGGMSLAPPGSYGFGANPYAGLYAGRGVLPVNTLAAGLKPAALHPALH